VTIHERAIWFVAIHLAVVEMLRSGYTDLDAVEFYDLWANMLIHDGEDALE
jgi:hypothetical protein